MQFVTMPLTMLHLRSSNAAAAFKFRRMALLVAMLSALFMAASAEFPSRGHNLNLRSQQQILDASTTVEPAQQDFKQELESSGSVLLESGVQSSVKRSAAQYKFLGPSDIAGAPVHETITSQAALLAGYRNAKAAASYKGKGLKSDWSKDGYDLFYSPQYADITRGAVWNDDPECLLFKEAKKGKVYRMANRFSLLKTSGPVLWTKLVSLGEAFGKCKSQADRLTCRSHFGALSFIHAQDADDGVPASEIVDKMVEWARLMYACATGKIKTDKSLEELPTPERGHYANVLHALGSTHTNKPLDLLFCNANKYGETSFRCAGSLAHLIEDSYSASHVRRACAADSENPFNTRLGDIVTLTAYSSQDEANHGSKDEFGTKAGSLKDRVKSTPGALDALEHVKAVFAMIVAKKPWDEVETYLRTKPWKLHPNVQDSSSGGFNRKLKEGTVPHCYTPEALAKPEFAVKPPTLATGPAPTDKIITLDNVFCRKPRGMSYDNLRILVFCNSSPLNPPYEATFKAGAARQPNQSFMCKSAKNVKMSLHGMGGLFAKSTQMDYTIGKNHNPQDLVLVNGQHFEVFKSAKGFVIGDGADYTVTYTVRDVPSGLGSSTV